MKILFLFVWLLFCVPVAVAQEELSVQFFLPGGVLPSQKLRFTAVWPDRRIEVFSTDASGKYTFSKELLSEGNYSLTVESDKRTYETASFQFRLNRSWGRLIPLFLPALKKDAELPAAPKNRKDLTDFDAQASPEAKAAYAQAVKYATEGKTNEAISEYTRALTLYPQYLRALNELGLFYVKLNRLNEAVSAFTQAVSLNSISHLPLLNLATTYLRQQNFNEAVRLFNQLLTEHPTLSAARVSYADVLIATQQWDEAEVQLREALKDSHLGGGDRAIAYLRLGVKLNRDERYASAAAQFEKAVALSPESAAAHLYLGAVQMQLEKYADAERELLKA